MLSNQIINWYIINKRDLPWRNTKDAYSIWISEIMLQQTRVATAIDYFNRFMARFPSVSDLALANEQEVLNMWQGLGYYSRARNLHAAAKTIQEEYDGIFPSTYQEIIKLKGIGNYTAAAISSFAYNLQYAAVDGNVYRVLSRIYGIENAIDSTVGKKYFQKIATETMSDARPEIYNQAIIEFGALQCIPRNPNCTNCPVQANCSAFSSNKVELLPLKSKQIKTKDRYFYYLFLSCNGRIFIEKRVAKDIWQNMYQYPLIESPKAIEINELIQSPEWNNFFDNEKLTIHSTTNPVVHKLSHQNLHATFVHVEVNFQYLARKNDLLGIHFSDLGNYPFPKLIENHLSTVLD